MEDEMKKLETTRGGKSEKFYLQIDDKMSYDMMAQGFVMDRANKYNKLGLEMKDKT